MADGTSYFTKANPQQVGRPASANKAIAMFKLTIELKLSYQQVMQILASLIVLFLG